MKKLLFYLLIIAEFFIFLKLIGIIVFDWSRLTEYGMGYFWGYLFNAVWIAVLMYFLGKNIWKKRSSVQGNH